LNPYITHPDCLTLDVEDMATMSEFKVIVALAGIQVGGRLKLLLLLSVVTVFLAETRSCLLLAASGIKG
jgi:hypothetical protein